MINGLMWIRNSYDFISLLIIFLISPHLEICKLATRLISKKFLITGNLKKNILMT